MFISSIGWALIHFLWQGTLITFAYWVITRNIQSVHAKYWTGMAMVIVSLLVPVINISTTQSSVVGSETLIPLSSTIISHQQLSIDGLFQYLINSSLPYVVMIWALTVIFLSFRLARSWIQLAAIKHECDPNTSRELKQYIKNIAIKLDLPTIPMLKISRQVLVPAAYGLFKPTILLPLSLINQIPQEQLEAIIKHELCHLKRNDFIHNIIQLCADILLFFHPGIKWMNNDIRHIREQCCDQLVLSHDTEKLTYAKALTNIAAFSSGMKLKPSVHLGINDGMLLNRVKFLLQNNSSQSSLMVFVPFLMLIIFMIVILQPANHDIDDMVSHQSNSTNTLQANHNDGETLQRKRLINQSFYPTFNKAPEATTVQTSVISEPVAYVEQDASLLNVLPATNPVQIIDRNTLLNEFKLDLELPATEAELTVSESITTNQFVGPEDSMVSAANLTNETADTLLEPAAIADEITSTSVLSSFDIKDSIKPKFKRYVAPEYPQYFWYNQVEQDVIATFKIQPNGRAYDISLTSQNNNFVAFEQSVEKAMKRWKFDTSSLNSSTLQRTYQQMFSFAISDNLIKNCEQKTTGTRLSKPMPCNK